jgi:hypothetical protein
MTIEMTMASDSRSDSTSVHDGSNEKRGLLHCSACSAAYIYAKLRFYGAYSGSVR